MPLMKIHDYAFKFKALGHPTRLEIVKYLFKYEEKCVCEITTMFDFDISTISKHLSILKNAGIIDFYKKSNMVIYYVKDKSFIDYLIKYISRG